MLKDLSDEVYAETLSIDEITSKIHVLDDAERVEVEQAIEFAKFVFQKQQTSLDQFNRLPHSEKVDYLSAVSCMREHYQKNEQFALVIGFHFLFHKLLSSLSMAHGNIHYERGMILHS